MDTYLDLTLIVVSQHLWSPNTCGSGVTFGAVTCYLPVETDQPLSHLDSGDIFLFLLARKDWPSHNITSSRLRLLQGLSSVRSRYSHLIKRIKELVTIISLIFYLFCGTK